MSLFKRKSEPVRCEDPFKNKVRCDGCKCWLDKDDAKVVEVMGGMWGSYEENYCARCKPPYDTKYQSIWNGKEMTAERFTRMEVVEVTADGKPIKK